MGEISFCVMVSVTAVMRDKRTHYFFPKMLNVSLQEPNEYCQLRTVDCGLWTAHCGLPNHHCSRLPAATFITNKEACDANSFLINTPS